MTGNENRQPITFTVGLPLFRARDIAWVALESLCRQKDADFPWELVVAEEQVDDAFGEIAVREYESALREAGCARIHYIPLDEWVPLSAKWRLLAAASSAASEFFALQAGDCYAQPYRLANTRRLFMESDADWVQAPLGPFYDICRDKVAVFDYDLVEDYPEPVHGCVKHPTALNMAVRTKYMRGLPNDDVRRGVDGWIYFSAQQQKGAVLRVAWDRSGHWRDGADTHGLNHISLGRGQSMTKLQPPFREFERPDHEIFPADIRERLVGLRTSAFENQFEALRQELASQEAKLKDFRGMIERRDEKIASLQEQVDRYRTLAEDLKRKQMRRYVFFGPRG